MEAVYFQNFMIMTQFSPLTPFEFFLACVLRLEKDFSISIEFYSLNVVPRSASSEFSESLKIFEYDLFLHTDIFIHCSCMLLSTV